jgi:hypothetical protein
MPSTQEIYAANLKCQDLGYAVYRPFKQGDHFQKVGDIAFFDGEGMYRWVQNAFHVRVECYFFGLLLRKQDLRNSQWPMYSKSEIDAVTEDTKNAPAIALGKDVKMTRTNVGAALVATISPESLHTSIQN